MVAAAQVGTFDIGRVIQRTFGAISRNFTVFFGMSVLLVGVPAWAAAVAELAENDAGLGNAKFVSGLLNFITSYILQAALVHATVSDLNGRRADFGASLAVGARMFLPVLAISILFGIAMALGLILLVVPGLFLLTIWLVAVPAQVVERTGIFGAFSRSSVLTEGHRWPVFGLIVIYAIVFLLLMSVMGLFTFATNPAGAGFLGTVAMALLQAVSSMLSAAGVAAIYYELRQAKEGAGPEDLAVVFA